MRRPRLYLDANATTFLHPEVAESMNRLRHELLGNPSSPHHHGRRARDRLEEARLDVARLVGSDPDEIYFTSGGTESNNLVPRLAAGDGPLWISAVEHPSLLEPARRAWARGRPGGTLAVDDEGGLREEPPAEQLDEAVVSLQWVNNETGVIQPLAPRAATLEARGALVHTDGAQGFFRLRDTVHELGVSAATITAHKSFGPVGVGALYLRRGVVVDPLLVGGPQERRVRPGTEDVVAIHGLGVLARLAHAEGLWPWEEMSPRRAAFRQALQSIPGAELITPEQGALLNTLSLSFPGLEGETILARLDMEGISASSGSACSSGAQKPSTVLPAMGYGDRIARGALRFSWGPEIAEADLLWTAERVAAIVEELRGRLS